MKTFKIVKLQILEADTLRQIELVDGLIINKENDHRSWIVEAYIDQEYYDYFTEAQQKSEELTVQVIITNLDNDFATFKCYIHTVKRIEDKISVLFEGTLNQPRNIYAEHLLRDLVDEGLSGNQLVQSFRDKMMTKPRLRDGK
jgi:hypothetical protein